MFGAHTNGKKRGGKGRISEGSEDFFFWIRAGGHSEKGKRIKQN